MTEERKVKVAEFIKGNVANFVVVISSVVYILYGMITIEKTGLTVAQVIAKAGVGIIIGLMIKQGVGENGFTKGYNSHIWQDTNEKYTNACNLANPHIEKIDNFYLSEEIEKKKIYRRQMLQAHQMKYNWFFDENGNYEPDLERYEKLTRKQRKVLNKCVKIKIYNLNLFSEYSNDVVVDTKREKTDSTQRSKMFGKNSVAQLITAVVGAYFIPLWTNWNWGAIIMSSIQVAIWLSTGVTQLYANYNYVVLEKTAKLKRKIELLIKFKKGCENGLYDKNPYDEV